jgi:hypothetical protein
LNRLRASLFKNAAKISYPSRPQVLIQVIRTALRLAQAT